MPSVYHGMMKENKLLELDNNADRLCLHNHLTKKDSFATIYDSVGRGSRAVKGSRL